MTRAYVPELVERLRVVTVAGVATGVAVLGVGGRLLMLVLRFTSSARARGLLSDDGFVMGRFTLDGTYFLLGFGAVFGVLGVVVHWMVRPWLLGPMWLRRATVAAGSGVTVGALLVHADGVDFTVLGPLWLTVGLCMAWPAAFAIAVGAVVDAVEAPTSWTRRGPWRWLLPAVLLAAFPRSAIAVAVVAPPIAVVLAISRAVSPGRRAAVVLGVRATGLAVAALGLIWLVSDVQALT